jgi:membrane protein implicated in regulation of membrane protease activity
VPDWAVWFIAAALLLAGEIATTAFILGPIGLAAFGAGLCAALGGSVEAQFAAFAALAVLSLVLIRPIARRHLQTPPLEQRTGASALIGLEALVLERVDRDHGQVKIEGDVWSARSGQYDAVFEPGTRVVVDSVHRGTIVHVSKRQDVNQPIAGAESPPA